MEALVHVEMLSVGWIIEYPIQCPREGCDSHESSIILKY